MGRDNEYLILKLVGFILVFAVLGVANSYVKTLLTTGIGLYYPYIALSLQFVVFGLGGVVFGLGKLFAERKQAGRWRINVPRLVVLGVPAFFFGLFLILTNLYPSVPFFAFIAEKSLFVNLMQMLVGYALITGFHKPGANGVRYWS